MARKRRGRNADGEVRRSENVVANCVEWDPGGMLKKVRGRVTGSQMLACVVHRKVPVVYPAIFALNLRKRLKMMDILMHFERKIIAKLLPVVS